MANPGEHEIKIMVMMGLMWEAFSIQRGPVGKKKEMTREIMY
jgi:hypothetical protein